MGLEDPDDLQQQPLVVRGGWSQPGHEFIRRFQHGVAGRIEEQTLRLITRPALRRAELRKQFGGLHRREVGLLDRRAALGGDAPDAAVRLVAARVGVAGLVMTDHWIEPVRHIDCSIRPDAHIHRPE